MTGDDANMAPPIVLVPNKGLYAESLDHGGRPEGARTVAEADFIAIALCRAA